MIDKQLNRRAVAIADEIEPRFRHGERSYGCGGHVAKLWGNAWEGAYLALGGKPEDYRPA